MQRVTWAFLAGAAALSACAPVENQRGYVPDQEAVASVQVGMDTKDTVTKKLGDPSTAATFGNDVWYYISAHVEQNAFFRSEAVASVQVGMDTKDTVTKKLGDPSTAATFGNDVWYYISAHVEQNAFF